MKTDNGESSTRTPEHSETTGLSVLLRNQENAQKTSVRLHQCEKNDPRTAKCSDVGVASEAVMDQPEQLVYEGWGEAAEVKMSYTKPATLCVKNRAGHKKKKTDPSVSSSEATPLSS